VHDIGGPVGFEMVSNIGADKLASLTITDTQIEVDKFSKPESMIDLEKHGPDRVFLDAAFGTYALVLENLKGEGLSTLSDDEIYAYGDLMYGDDNADAFLKIMKGFECTPEKAALYCGIVSSAPRKQVIWADDDSSLYYEEHGKIAERVAGMTATVLPGQHWALQEVHFEAVAEAVHKLATSSKE